MKCFALFVVLATTIGSSVCFRLDALSKNLSEDRILGGETAKLGQLPYMVSVRQQIPGADSIAYSHKCGGALISDRWIVSAAHPYKANPDPDRLVAYVEAHHIREDGQMYRLDRISLHPSYNSSFKQADISLLRTAAAVKFNNRVQPIPVSGQFVDGGHTSIISGWGVYKKNGTHGMFPDHLQVLAVKTITEEQCRPQIPPELRQFLYVGSLCINVQRGQGACVGDSGGPLASDGRLIGVVSWGLPCAHGVPDVFTRLSTFAQWIQEVSGVVAV